MTHEPQVDHAGPEAGDGGRQPKQLPVLTIPVVAGCVVAVLLVGIVLAIGGGRPGFLAAQGDGLLSVATREPLPTRPWPFPGVPRITVQETTAGLNRGLVLVDVRSKAAYDKAHASGALSVPEDEIESRLAELPLDKELVLYCTWGQEQQSARAAQKLVDLGAADVKALAGGFAAWQNAGLPVESSAP